MSESSGEVAWETFGRFTLLRPLGRGGMGEVFEAIDPDRPERIALKRAYSGVSMDARHVERFEREARVVSRLAHPNIVPIHEFGVVDGRPFVTMALIHGTNLSECQPLSVTQEVARLVKVVRAVGFAHDQRVVHRDLKPSNILIGSDDQAFVADFGLATYSDATRSLTESNARLGTLRYMSPEQAEGYGGSILGDVYALGAILFERVCGVPLYPESELAILLQKVRFAAAPNLAMLERRCDTRLARVIRKCLHRHAHDRYTDCHSLSNDLERWLLGEEPQARELGTLKRMRRWASYNPRGAFLITMVFLLLAGACVLGVLAMSSRSQTLVSKYYRQIEVARSEVIELRPGWKARATEAALSAALIGQGMSSSLQTSGEGQVQSLLAKIGLGFDIGTPRFAVRHENTRVLRFHPTRPWLFIGAKYASDQGSDCQILVVDTVNGNPIGTMVFCDSESDKRSGIVDMAMIDEEQLAVVTRAGRIQLFALSPPFDGPWRPIREIETPIRNPAHLACTPLVNRILVTGFDSPGEWQIVSYDVQNWNVFAHRSWDRGITSAAASSDKSVIYLSEDSQLSQVNPISLERENTAPCDVGILAYDRGRLAILRRLGLAVHNAANLRIVGEVQPPPGGFATSYWDSEVRFSPNGDLLILGDRERNQIHVFSTTDYCHLQTVFVESTVYRNVHFAVSNDQNLLAMTGGVVTSLAPIHAGSVHQVHAGIGEVQQAAFAPESGVMAVLTDTAREWYRCELFVMKLSGHNRPERQAAVTSLESTPRYLPACLALSADGKRIASLIEEPEWSSPRVAILDAASMGEIGRTVPLAGFRSMAFGDHHTLFTCAAGGVLQWDETATQRIASWLPPEDGSWNGGTKFPAFALSGNRVFLGDEDGYITFLLWPNPKLERLTALGATPVTVCAPSADDTVAAIGDGNGTIVIVDTGSGVIKGRYPAFHQGAISALAWTQSGMLISCGKDQTLCICEWNGQSQRLKRSMTVRLRGNVRQVFPLPGTSSKEYEDELVMLREGAYALERWRPRKTPMHLD